MTSVNDPRYKAKVQAFGDTLTEIHLKAGEPSLRLVKRLLEKDPDADFVALSEASISRYLNGQILPRGDFIEAFLRVIKQYTPENLNKLLDLRTEARKVLKNRG